MKISKVTFTILAMAIAFIFAAQPLVQATQGVETFWPITSGIKGGDGSTGFLTIYYEVVGWDAVQGEETVLMFFFLRLYEKKTRQWLFISDVAQKTTPLTYGHVNRSSQIALEAFLNGPVREQLCCNPTEVFLTDVENDYHNLPDDVVNNSNPPFGVSADITIVAK
jgi:hypothetical protein